MDPNKSLWRYIQRILLGMAIATLAIILLTYTAARIDVWATSGRSDAVQAAPAEVISNP